MKLDIYIDFKIAYLSSKRHKIHHETAVYNLLDSIKKL